MKKQKIKLISPRRSQAISFAHRLDKRLKDFGGLVHYGREYSDGSFFGTTKCTIAIYLPTNSFYLSFGYKEKEAFLLEDSLDFSYKSKCLPFDQVLVEAEAVVLHEASHSAFFEMMRDMCHQIC